MPPKHTTSVDRLRRHHLRIRGSTDGFRYEVRRVAFGQIHVDTFDSTLITDFRVDPMGYCADLLIPVRS